MLLGRKSANGNEKKELSNEILHNNTDLLPKFKSHIGTAYTTIAADAMARLRRMKGDDVFFLTGQTKMLRKLFGRGKCGLDPHTMSMAL